MAVLLEEATESNVTNQRMQALDKAKGIKIALEIPEEYRKVLSDFSMATYGKNLTAVEAMAAEYTGASVVEAAKGEEE